MSSERDTQEHKVVSIQNSRIIFVEHLKEWISDTSDTNFEITHIVSDLARKSAFEYYAVFPELFDTITPVEIETSTHELLSARQFSTKKAELIKMGLKAFLKRIANVHDPVIQRMWQILEQAGIDTNPEAGVSSRFSDLLLEQIMIAYIIAQCMPPQL